MRQLFRIASVASGVGIACGAGGQALAAPGDSFTLTGNAQVSVVEPIGVQNVADLRFGRIMQPTAGGTLTISPAGAVTESGGVVGMSNTPQLPTMRGPGAFAVFGDANRRFIPFLPNNTTISNGVSTMLVNQFQLSPSSTPGLRRFDANGYAPLLVGARLNVGANQAVGTYTGTYTVTVLYL